jgi:xylulokinase
MSHVVAIDLGSSGVKVAVVDRDARVAGSASAALPTIFLRGGGAEQDAEGWWRAIGDCSRRALRDSGVDGGSIEAVAATAQYMSIVAVDARGRPLMNTIMWMDGRGARHHLPLGNADDEALWLERHGMAPMGADDQAHIAFIRNEHPDVYAAAAAFLEPVDYVNARLTGRIAATHTTAFPLMTVDNRVRGVSSHDPDLVARAGVDPAKLPPIVPYDEILGLVTPEAADHLGIAPTAVVVTGTIDSITSAVGCGAIDSASCAVVVGTTTVIVTHVDDMRADREHGLLSVPSPLPGRYFVMAENGIGGKALEFFLTNVVYPDDAFALGEAPADAYARLEAAAAAVEPGSGGAMFLPWLVGSIAPSPNSDVRGGFINIGLRTTRAHLARAVYEGVALNAAWLLPHVAAFAGARWRAVRFGGGGAASDFWAQLLADATGLEVEQLAGAQSTNARGAAFLALHRLGHIDLDDISQLLDVKRSYAPDPTRAERYARLGRAFVDFHTRSAPFYAALNRRT